MMNVMRQRVLCSIILGLLSLTNGLHAKNPFVYLMALNPLRNVEADTIPPAAPQNLTARESDNRVILTWTANTENDLLRYRIYRGTSSPANTKIDSTSADVNTYTDKNVVNDKTYFYRITAVDQSFNQSAFSEEVTATPALFTDSFVSLSEVEQSSVAWGDYDSDGDLDILLTGSTVGFNAVCKIYRNDRGSFVDILAPLTAVRQSAVAWGDYDNDGDLDILLTGFDNSFANVSKIYRNDGGNFVDIGVALVQARNGSVDWGDYDNDGDLDILLTGSSTLDLVSKVYRNDSGSFVDISAALPGIFGSAVWGDYDNDGDLDILLTGQVLSGFISKVFRNDNGSFIDISAGLPGVSGSAIWGDYDNDGDLDILLTGQTVSGYLAKIYRNDGGSFVDIAAALIGVQSESMAWGDYDNDGDLDVLLQGDSGPLVDDYITKIYRNDNGIFVETPISLLKAEVGSVAWGDYDNDGDLDILLTGSSPEENQITKIYRNNIGKANTIPNAPTSLNASAKGDSVTLRWNKATDNQTASSSLTYNLRLGTISGGVQKVSPMANVTTGYRKVPKPGNVNHNNSWTIKNLPEGKYYWSVQAIDHAFAGSAFAAEQSFVTNLAPAAPQNLLATAGDRQVTLTWAANSENDFLRYRIYGGATANPTTRLDSVNGISNTTKLITGLSNGITYYFRIAAVDTAQQESLFSNEVNVIPRTSDIPPAAPQNLRAILGDRQVTLTWTANSETDLLRYRIYGGTTANPTANLDSVNAISNTTKIIDGLVNGVTYYFRITAVDAALQESGYSNQVSAKPTSADVPPAPPQNLRATAGDRRVTLVWNANTDTDFLRYRIYGGTAVNPTARIDSVNGISNTSKVLTGLNNGVIYYFRMTAVDVVLQESAYSNEVSVTMPPLDTMPPNITHAPLLSQMTGQEIPIDATITDNIGVVNATLNYRKGGDVTFITMFLVKTGNSFRGSIPATVVTTRGVEYYIAARDSAGLMAQSAKVSVQVRVSGQGEIKGSAQPGGTEQIAYRLISMPLDLDNKSPRTVLEDDLGPYDIFKWRCYEIRANQTRAEFPNISEMVPGKAFWLIVKNQGMIIDTGPGISNSTLRQYAMALHPKWNAIGNPFNFPIPVTILRLKSNGQPPELRAYMGTWNDPVNAKINVMEPFEGYAMHNGLATVDTLFINTDLSASVNSLFDETRSSAFMHSQPLKGKLQTLWSIRILAQCQQARDIDNIVAVSSNASNTHDELDRPEPPVIGEYVSVYFPHPEWEKLSENYCTDFRPQTSDAELWTFEVKTNIRDVVQLSFEGLDSVPPEFEVWLADDLLKISQNLREKNQYTVAGTEHPKRLKLVVGKGDFIDKQIAAGQAIPSSYELSQNFPNPFKPVTTIRYGLPKEERVTLKVYNLSGQEVATLVNYELKNAGYHMAIWDGRNGSGKTTASGVYFIRMRAGPSAGSGQVFVQTRKMVLVE